MNTNWTDNLTPEQLQDCYNEIVDYFNHQVLNEVLEKYHKSIDIQTLIV